MSRNVGRWVAGVLLVAGCGPSESEFVVEYTDAYCAYYLDCSDPAILVFDGLDAIDDCVAVAGPENAARASGCKLERTAARACLDQMATVACPTDGTPVDEALPTACTATWKNCSDQPEDEPADETNEQ
ncbi:MAG: hypothetical protein ABMB14_22995 [Myxococcota bacterium]